jgi:hypothetical protein
VKCNSTPVRWGRKSPPAFVSHCHGIAGIGALADGAAILAGEKGTLIRLETTDANA